ncbi:MAG: AtpZ/AtpI family protein [Thermodesulfovibrio sp.]|uniref:AtpZ/AtpI family protein n=1 Tax=Thermodesulfovibrio obliviosus TaxID=3118332 RepID=A0AAU8H247_9BACT
MEEKRSFFKTFIEASALGINFVLCVLIGAGIGYLIDYYLTHSFPLFSIIFLMAGFVAGVKEIFKYIKKVEKVSGQGSNKENK